LFKPLKGVVSEKYTYMYLQLNFVMFQEVQQCLSLCKIFILTDGHLYTFYTARRDHMVVGFINTYTISAYRCKFETRSCEVYSIQHYVITFVSDFLWFPLPIKLTATI
jgi:hypothetical protein